ncbi:MAG: recombinase family protein [Kiritimatiellae bacterium]|nr:recombinase family protein [Kiritimatiellia bacterium]
MKTMMTAPAFRKAGVSLSAPCVRVAIYTRKSVTMGLDQEYNSLAAQEDSCRAYINAQAGNGWVAAEVYSDPGFSGGSLKRPAMDRLRADAKAGKFDIVIAYKLDRLTRSLKDFMTLSGEFGEHGIGFVSVTQQIDTSNAAGRMLVGVLASFAEFERDMIRERIRDKYGATLKKGLWPGGKVPYGYRVFQRRLIVDAATAPHVRKMFEWYLDCGSMVEVARRLNKSGFTGGRTKWNAAKVSVALKNARYAGLCECLDGELVKGEHDAIIARELFDAVQKRRAELAGEGGKGRPRMRHNALLAKLAFCGHCKTGLTKRGTYKNGSLTQYAYYACCRHAKTVDSGCTVKYIPARLLEGTVESAIETAFRTSLEFAVDMSLKTGLEQSRILGALRGHGLLWRELSEDERYTLVRAAVVRATVYPESIEVVLETSRLGSLTPVLGKIGTVLGDGNTLVRIPLAVKTVKNGSGTGVRKENAAEPGRPKTPEEMLRDPLISNLARGAVYMGMLDRGEAKTITDLARKTRTEAHIVMRGLRLATLSPAIQSAIIAGRAPSDLSVSKLCALGTEDWDEQERIAGIAS